MLAARLVRLPVTSGLMSSCGSAAMRQILSKPVNSNTLTTRLQTYATRTAKRAKRVTLKERLMSPADGSVISMGQGLVAGGAFLGLGALCYYGIGLSNELGAVDRAALWSPEIKKRIRDTYMYFGATIGATAASAVAVSRTPAIMNLMMKNSWLAIGATVAAMIGAGVVVRSIPYQEGFGMKQLAWLGYAGVMGAVVAPLTLLGGPLLVRAAWYTTGVVGGLSAVAMCAPSEKFLNMGGPLAIGLGVVFVSSIGSSFLPPTTALGAGLYSISMYGGLVLFSLFLLYDTQKIIKVAENHPTYAMKKYDPINACLGIYIDTLNIFMRIAMMLAGGGNKRK